MSELLTSPAVTQWMTSVGMDSSDPRLSTLSSFCEGVGLSPDELVDSCLSDAGDGQKKIRMKQRRVVAEQIEAFQQRPEVGRQMGNVVRSFFIHNGVSMQVGGILR